MMDISRFELLNVADACSLWNVLASRLLYATARVAKVQLCCTTFVVYECLHKRGQNRAERAELQQRLAARLADRSIVAYPIDIEDLQQVGVLQNRKRLGLGELSALVFATKTQQALLTDDMGAQKLARTHMHHDAIQSTPHLVAWLYFTSLLGDDDVLQVKAEMAALCRCLDPHLENYHREAQRCRAMVTQADYLAATREQ